ncbi:MAG: DUF1573 domain-containing protein [candidate division Zixibacteria bacterium]|nr:DUF1573 domain-containing protein [candidate division Zixibacteria bacterium]
MKAAHLWVSTILLALIVIAPPGALGQTSIWYTERIHDFGGVGIDFEVYHDFKLFNRGVDTMKIDSVKVNCDCSTVSFLDSVLAPGDTVSFRLSFSTMNYYGRVSKAVRVWTSDPQAPKLELFYLSTVGQWFYKVKPDPVSLFFLPGQKSRTAGVLNTAMEELVLDDIFVLDEGVISVTPTRSKAAQGERIELEVRPSENLEPGTYLTNYRLSFDVPGDEPLLMTIPVRVVRY